MKRKSGVIGLIVLGVLLVVWAFARSDFIAQDSCLDAGGRWDDGACEGARPNG